jgi:starch synthase
LTSFPCRYEFFNYSPVLNGQMRYETEFDWGGTRICVTSAIVEELRVWFIEPRNGFFNTQTVYGRYDDEVKGGWRRAGVASYKQKA